MPSDRLFRSPDAFFPIRSDRNYGTRFALKIVKLSTDNNVADRTVIEGADSSEQPTIDLDEPKFTCFPRLPIELRLKIWSFVQSPPRIISIKRNPLRILPIKSIPLRATCVESRGIPSPHLMFFRGVAIDFAKDTFLFPDSHTVYALDRRLPSLGNKIRSLAIEGFNLQTEIGREYVRYTILDVLRSLGNVEELIIDLARMGGVPRQDWREQLREFLETQKANDDNKSEGEEYYILKTEDYTWTVPEIPALLERVGFEPISFEDEVMEWFEASGR